MTDGTQRLPLRTQGRMWGPERVALGLSIRELSRLSGINRGILSMVESGRIVPSGDEYQAVMAALRKVREPEAAA